MTPFQKQLRKNAVLVAAMFAAFISPSHATLGKAPTEFVNTSTMRGQVLAGSFNQAPTQYKVRSSTLPSGTSIKEYVANDGIVFAVTWAGPFLPDLQELLGASFGSLKTESARLPKAGRGQVVANGSDVTVESTGRMRAFRGRAWIHSKLPAGLTPKDIE